MLTLHNKEFILELQHTKKPQGILCDESILVKVHDVGGGPFLSLKTVNHDPEEEFDEGQ